MREFNLDEAKAARAEVEAEDAGFVFGGERFALPPRLPIGVIEHLAAYTALGIEAKGDDVAKGEAMSELLKACEALLGVDAWTRFKDLGADYADVLALLQGTVRLYRVGEDVGESGASGGPSTDGGDRSRQTGSDTTEGTSGEISTEPASASGA